MALSVKHAAASLAVAIAGLGGQATAHAADGCTFLLCIAGPWQSIAECVPTVTEVFSDLAHGRPFPSCAMSGGPGNQASHRYIRAEQDCPPWMQVRGPYGEYRFCTAAGKITVMIDGQWWSDVYWNTSTTQTSYSANAKTQLGSGNWDPTYEQSEAAWIAANPPPAP